MAQAIQRKSQPNLLEGPLFGKIVAFVFPLVITNMLQRLYNAADMIIVGMSGVEGALGAIGLTGAMVNLILNIFMGLAVGTNVVVARWIGAGDRNETERAVHTSLIVSVIFGLACSLLGVFITRPVMSFLGAEGHILELSVYYCYVYFAGVPFLSVTNFAICIFRAKGDTKTPLWVLSASGLINVGLNLFFVKVCDMHVDGVALATSIANVVSAFVLVRKLRRGDDWCRFEPKKLRLNKKTFLDILRVGIPSSLQSMMFNLSNMVIQSSIMTVNNTECPGGSAVIDGSSAAGNVETFVYTAANSVYQGSVTFVSQHYGAGKIQRIKKVMGNCYLLSAIVSLGFAGIILLFQEPLIGLYVSDPKAIEVAYLRDGLLLVPYFLCGFFEVGSGILRGMGRSGQSAFLTFLTICVFRVAWNLIMFPIYPTLFCVFISYPISWILATLVTFFYSVVVIRKELKKQAANQAG